MADDEAILHRRVANAFAAKRYRQKLKEMKQATPEQVQGEEDDGDEAGHAKRRKQTEKKTMVDEAGHAEQTAKKTMVDEAGHAKRHKQTEKKTKVDEAGHAKQTAKKTMVDEAGHAKQTEKKTTVIAPSVSMNAQAKPHVVNCMACQFVVPVGASFCIDCGVDLRVACSHCGKKFPIHFCVCTACVAWL